MNCYLVDFGSSFVKYSVYNSNEEAVILEDKFPFPEPIINSDKKYIVSIKDIDNIIYKIKNLSKKYLCKKIFISANPM